MSHKIWVIPWVWELGRESMRRCLWNRRCKYRKRDNGCPFHWWILYWQKPTQNFTICIPFLKNYLVIEFSDESICCDSECKENGNHCKNAWLKFGVNLGWNGVKFGSILHWWLRREHKLKCIVQHVLQQISLDQLCWERHQLLW